MFKLKMRFQMLLLMCVIFIATEVKANPINLCTKMIPNNGFDTIMKLEGEEQFKALCESTANYFSCINNAMRIGTNLSIREAAEQLANSSTGKALQIVVNIEDLFEELCTEGSDLNKGYLASLECFQNFSSDPFDLCQQQASDVSEIFNEVRLEREELLPTDEVCVTTAQHLGCFGANVYEKCGEEAYSILKEIVIKIGAFKSGMCSSKVMDIIKTTLIDRLDMSDSRKNLYLEIINLRKRRK